MVLFVKLGCFDGSKYFAKKSQNNQAFHLGTVLPPSGRGDGFLLQAPKCRLTMSMASLRNIVLLLNFNFLAMASTGKTALLYNVR